MRSYEVAAAQGIADAEERLYIVKASNAGVALRRAADLAYRDGMRVTQGSGVRFRIRLVG